MLSNVLVIKLHIMNYVIQYGMYVATLVATIIIMLATEFMDYYQNSAIPNFTNTVNRVIGLRQLLY